jgi:transcriptional regulator GlxA family with amidase domain
MVHAAIAATIIETLQAVNSVSGTKIFSFEFVAKQSRAVSKAGIRFNANPEASKKIDVLILLAGTEAEAAQTIQLLDRETTYVLPVIHQAQRHLQFLARRLGTSSRTLSRRFVNELQITPGKRIQEKRLEMARSLLKTTRLSVSEICHRVGYQDVASFSRLFARRTGMPPADFRKQIVSRGNDPTEKQ